MKIILSFLSLFLISMSAQAGQLFPPSGLVGKSCPSGHFLTWEDESVVCKQLDFSKLNIVTSTATLCKRHGAYTVIATCPAGSSLLSCGGGSGDLYEDSESWQLIPDFPNQRCLGYVREPACSSAADQTVVVAICSKN